MRQGQLFSAFGSSVIMGGNQVSNKKMFLLENKRNCNLINNGFIKYEWYNCN
jgi:hypothetical protein